MKHENKNKKQRSTLDLTEIECKGTVGLCLYEKANEKLPKF